MRAKYLDESGPMRVLDSATLSQYSLFFTSSSVTGSVTRFSLSFAISSADLGLCFSNCGRPLFSYRDYISDRQ